MKYLIGIVALFFIVSAFAFNDRFISDDFELAKKEILFRKLGHEILLNSGDSTSRVLPVKKIAANEYLITFEKEFIFQPDSLVDIVKRVLIKSGLPENYIVRVLNCNGSDVEFGYMIFGEAQGQKIPCSGRKQPKGCYAINLKFKDEILTTTEKNYLTGSIPFLGFLGLLIFSSAATKKLKLTRQEKNGQLKLGSAIFDVAEKQLYINDTTVGLTDKENKILFMLAVAPNIVIERNQLQKEIWEDEGVIVGRSLDVFISKLRKKLEADPAIQLVNVHGRGYKLVIG